MELLAIWILASLDLALLWYVWTQNENHFYENRELQAERLKLAEMLYDMQKDMAKERRELYDRLQAGTLPQFKQFEDTPDEEEDEDPVVDLEDAKDDLMGVAHE